MLCYYANQRYLEANVAAETDKIERYLNETLGITAKISVWKAGERLPLFLRDGYRFFETFLLGLPCVLMVDQAQEAPSPANARKHMDQVESKWDGDLIYVRHQLASHQRKRLIEQRVPFLVPGNQMYLPMLGIDLREHFRKQRQTPLTLKPATQVLVLQLLLRPEEELRTPLDFANRLGYTKMTMSRAFDELEAEQLCDISKEGRERKLRLAGTRHELWNHVLPLLRTPVKQRNHIGRSDIPQVGVAAGLTALANRSMLAAPKTAVVAVSSEQWQVMKRRKADFHTTADAPDAVEMEVWSYDPLLFSTEGTCDPYSLFLSLQDNKDERIEAALEEMMEAIQW